MKTLLNLIALLFVTLTAFSQEVVSLPYKELSDMEYPTSEKKYYNEAWQTTVVTNVSKPTLTVYRPSSEKRNGSAVIIAPGGGLFALSINSEGQDVAQWLVAKGYTAFVLKYRLVHTGEAGANGAMQRFQQDPVGMMNDVKAMLPYSVSDGLNAVKHVRENAEAYGVSPDKIGFMGFSAGGAVTMGVGYNYDKSSRPDFLVPVYAWTDAQPVKTPPADSPPVMIICATDDGLGLATGSVDLYKSYYDAGISVGLHMYSRGDHGFGMKTQGLPSDHWIERFYEWAKAESLVTD